MPTPAEIAALPTTPGSIVRASAAFSTRKRGWTLAANGRWCEPFGPPRSAAQLRDVEVLYVAPPAETTSNVQGQRGSAA